MNQPVYREGGGINNWRTASGPGTARQPNEVWSWDITYLKGAGAGHVLLSIPARLVQSSPGAEFAADLVTEACHLGDRHR